MNLLLENCESHFRRQSVKLLVCQNIIDLFQNYLLTVGGYRSLPFTLQVSKQFLYPQLMSLGID